MRAFVTVALVLLTTATLAAEPRTVVVYGDSITEGGALPKESRDQAWVNVVTRESHGTLQLINEGKGGRPTDSLKEFEAMLKRQPHCDVLVIALGGNDSRDITDACIPKAVKNVTAMIELARKTYGPRTPILLVGPLNINKNALGPTKPIANEREGKVIDLGKAFAQLAKDQQCQYVSWFGVVAAENLTKDGVHPDMAGNAAIAKVMLQTLAALPK